MGRKKKIYYIRSDVFAEWLYQDMSSSDLRNKFHYILDKIIRGGSFDLQNELDNVGYLESHLIDNWDLDEEGELGADFDFDFNNAEFKIVIPQESEVK